MPYPFIPARIPSDQMTMGADVARIPGSEGLSNSSLLTLLMDKLKNENDINSPAWDTARQAVTPSNDPADMAMAFGASIPNFKPPINAPSGFIHAYTQGGKTRVDFFKDPNLSRFKYVLDNDKNAKLIQMNSHEGTLLNPRTLREVEENADIPEALKKSIQEEYQKILSPIRHQPTTSKGRVNSPDLPF